MFKYILVFILFILYSPINYANKAYTQEEASSICASAVNKMLDDLDALAKQGLTKEQLKEAVATTNPEMLALIKRFIDVVMQNKHEEAAPLLLQIHILCTQKIQEVEA